MITSIKGIELQVELNAALGHTDSLDAKLSWNGGSSLTASKSNSWTNQEVYKSYGSSTDLWGRSWTDTEFSNSNFRVYFNQPSNWYGYGVDHLRVKVSYIVPAGSGGTGTTTTMYPNNLYEVTGTTSTKNIYAGDMLVASIELDTPVPKIYYTHLDHLGSTNVVTDEIGYMGQLLSYHPFGSPRVEEQYGGMIQKNQFIGQDYDSESEMSYLNARYLNNKRGQFISQDPVFLEMGLGTTEGQMVIRNPQALNSYSYAQNNPIVYKDPDGRCPVCALMLVGAAANMAAQGIEDYTAGNEFQWQNYAGAAVGGAVGAGALLLNPVGGAVTVGAVTSGSEDLATQFFTKGTNIDYQQTRVEILKGGVFGQAGKYIKIPSVTTGRNSLQAVTNSIFTKVGNGTIQNLSGQTGAKIFATQTLGNTPQSLYNGGSSNKSLQKQIQNLQKQVISILQKKVNSLKKKLGN